MDQQRESVCVHALVSVGVKRMSQARFLTGLRKNTPRDFPNWTTFKFWHCPFVSAFSGPRVIPSTFTVRIKSNVHKHWVSLKSMQAWAQCIQHLLYRKFRAKLLHFSRTAAVAHLQHVFKALTERHRRAAGSTWSVASRLWYQYVQETVQIHLNTTHLIETMNCWIEMVPFISFRLKWKGHIRPLIPDKTCCRHQFIK